MAGDGRLERYRLNAEKCLTLAQTFTNVENKRALLAMANAWLTLAEQHLSNSETILVHETPSSINEPPQPGYGRPQSPAALAPPEPPPIGEPPPPATESPKSPPIGEAPSMSLDPVKSDDPTQS